MRHPECGHIDFDDWAALAVRDPEAFEARRAQVIEEFIQQVPEAKRTRLRRLQWRIDMTRRRASNPVSACIRISQMMWDSLLGEGGLLEALEQFSGREARPLSRRGSAEVITFKRHH